MADRTRMIALRVTPSELALLAEQAAAAGVSRTELIRRRVLGRPMAHNNAEVLVAVARLQELICRLEEESRRAEISVKVRPGVRVIEAEVSAVRSEVWLAKQRLAS